jgi:steroid delta-isomerase-like uncharacterized protein
MNSKDLIQDLYAAFEARNLDQLLAFWNEDCELVDVPVGTITKGKPALRDFMQYLYAALPDLRVENLRIIGDEAAAATQFDLVGTHGGVFFDRPPSGRSVRWQLCSIFDIDSKINLIEKEAYYYDRAGLLEQLDA